LILYVAVIEPLAGVRAQSWIIWAIAAAGLVLAVRIAMSTREADAARQFDPSPSQVTDAATLAAPAATVERPVLWFALSFAASLCLFSVNTYLATDVASFPLLFAVPLAIFL